MQWRLEISQAMKEIATLALIYVNQIQDVSDNACNGTYLHVRSHDRICDIYATVGEALKHLERAINSPATRRTPLEG